MVPLFEWLTDHIQNFLVPEVKKKKGIDLNIYNCPERNALFSNRICSSGIVEAASCHTYKQLALAPTKCKRSWIENSWSSGKAPPKLYPQGDNLLGPHRDLHNDSKDKRYGNVVTVWNYSFDLEKKIMCRDGVQQLMVKTFVEIL